MQTQPSQHCRHVNSSSCHDHTEVVALCVSKLFLCSMQEAESEESECQRCFCRLRHSCLTSDTSSYLSLSHTCTHLCTVEVSKDTDPIGPCHTYMYRKCGNFGCEKLNINPILVCCAVTSLNWAPEVKEGSMVYFKPQYCFFPIPLQQLSAQRKGNELRCVVGLW